MSTVLKLTSITFNEGDSIDIEFDWNGNTYSHQFASAQAMGDIAANPLETTYEAAKFLVTGLFAKDANPANFGNFINTEFSIEPNHVNDALAGTGGFLRWTVS